MSLPKLSDRRSRLLLAAITLLAASTAARAAEPTPSVEFRNCSEQTAILSYPAGPYRDLLPPGFRFPGLAGAGLSVLVSAAEQTVQDLGIADPDLDWLVARVAALPS